MDHTEFKLKQKKKKKEKQTQEKQPKQSVLSTPYVQFNTCSYKGGTKGARIEHKSTGVPINFLSQLLKCKSLRQDMNFTRLLLSRAVWLPLLKE